jgi:hypothetical protein
LPLPDVVVLAFVDEHSDGTGLLLAAVALRDDVDITPPDFVLVRFGIELGYTERAESDRLAERREIRHPPARGALCRTPGGFVRAEAALHGDRLRDQDLERH